jgi:hypothetical protein
MYDMSKDDHLNPFPIEVFAIFDCIDREPIRVLVESEECARIVFDSYARDFPHKYYAMSKYVIAMEAK